MKKTFLSLILALVLSGCGSGNLENRLENRPVHLSLEVFTSEMELISQEVKMVSEIDLTGCEIGYAIGDGFQVQKWGNEETCAILLVSSDQVGQSAFLNSFLFDTTEKFIVASTQDIVGPDYPIILVPQGSYDLYYLVRVMAHEGLHMERIKNRTNTLTDIEEEVLAYELQMGILEKQYTSIQLEDMISYVIPGLPEYHFEALKMESEIYQAFKEGNLKIYLESISYSSNW